MKWNISWFNCNLTFVSGFPEIKTNLHFECLDVLIISTEGKMAWGNSMFFEFFLRNSCGRKWQNENLFHFRETRHECQITNKSWYASFHFSFVDKITEFPEKIVQNKAVFEISGAVISKSKIWIVHPKLLNVTTWSATSPSSGAHQARWNRGDNRD